MSEEPHINFESRRRYNTHELTDEQIALIAKKAIELIKEDITEEVLSRVEERFYTKVGKTVTDKVLVIVGIAAVSVWVWLTSHGIIPKND